jgi:hypothetical protein
MKAQLENWFWHSCFTFLHLWNSVASGKFFFYTVNNPSMHYGGAFLDRKTTLLRQLREGWIQKDSLTQEHWTNFQRALNFR